MSLLHPTYISINTLTTYDLFTGGSITLSTSSPFDHPAIDLNLLDSPIDIAILIEGIRSANRLFSSSTFSKNVFGLVAPQPNSDGELTDEILANFIRNQVSHFGHAVGSCSMAPHGAKWGVVDPEFRVRDVQGLRIVDASVIVSRRYLVFVLWFTKTNVFVLV